METAIISGILKEVIISLGRFSYNEIMRCTGVEDEVRNLERSLEGIEDDIRNVDLRFARSVATIRDLKTLTEFSYEAESIIDRFKIEMAILYASRSQECRPSSACSLCREVGIRHQAANDIEKLNKQLQIMRTPRGILGQRVAMEGEAEAMEGQAVVQSHVKAEGPGHGEPKLIGSAITNDSNDFIERLCQDGGNALFAIVGAPGVGKTTLAQKIYHDKRTKVKFPNRLWVSHSRISGNLTIYTGDVHSDDRITPPMQIIRSQLHTRQLLLVIDGVRDNNNWNFLGDLEDDFIDRNIRVIITTSHMDVTTMIGVARGSYYHHYVRNLGEDDGWLLLRWAAKRPKSDPNIGDVQDVGRRIVQKCSGLPMALKAFGCRLRSMDRADEWETVHATDFIHRYPEIRRCIDTSYMELQYPQKRCFLYCSLYPEGSVIEQRCITQQWIAEGFFEGTESSGETPDADQEKEARSCFTEFVNRGLLVQNKYNGADGASGGVATMLGLLRSYAIYRSQNEKMYRQCVADAEAVYDIPDNFTRLRTLMALGSSNPEDDTDSRAQRVMDRICTKFESLRVLDLRDTQVKFVGSKLKRLLQLRYLNLSNTSIETLSPQIGNLKELQFLILENCRQLTSLPREVGCLKKLRCLDISGTPELKDVKFSLADLEEVNCFRGFIPVSSGHGWRTFTFRELSHMTKLTSLQIDKLGRNTVTEEAAQLSLQEKTRLQDLELCCTTPDGIAEPDRVSIRSVLDELKPHQGLATLKLANFYGSELPTWVSPAYLTVLQRLTLDGCSGRQHLPPLGQMRHLTFLAIRGFSLLPEISQELRGVPGSEVAFPKLQELIMGEMDNLMRWLHTEAHDMPLLCSFQLLECPRLQGHSLWLRHRTALTSLKIQCSDELQEIRELPELNELHVDNCGQLRTIGSLGKLEDLIIARCSNLSTVQGVDRLRSLRLEEEQAMELPRWLQEQQRPPFPLSRLDIVGSEQLLRRCFTSTGIQTAADHVHAMLPDGSTYFSYTKSTGHSQWSQQWKEAVRVHGAVTVPIPQPGRRGIGESWMRYTLYTLYAVILVVSQWFVLRIVGSRS
ncbi:hypothetical protein ACP70R_049502 [Stipagrostis hirtigluma subsp. patula]